MAKYLLRALFALSALCLALLLPSASACAALQYVVFSGAPDAFPIVSAGQPATLFVAAEDYPGVARAVADLQSDIARVTGKSATITHDEKSLGKNVIIIGTLGKSPLIDRLVAAGKIDVAPIKGKWESFLIQVVPRALARC